MKILWVHSFDSQISNSGIFMHNFAKYLNKYIDLKLLPIWDLSFKSNFSNAFKKLQNETKDVDIVHAQYGSGCGFITSFLKKKKILSLRGSDFNTFFSIKAPKETFHSLIAKSLTKYSLKRYNHVLVVSKKMQVNVSQYLPKGNISIMPSPIDLEKFHKISRNYSRKKLGFDNNSNPWILISSLQSKNPIKRIDMALKAFEIVKKMIPNAELKFLNNIPGNQVVYWINSSNVILLTSVYEGWPNIIKEGLACNIPFVSTDISDLKEVSEKYIQCKIAKPTPQDLANKLISVLTRDDVIKNLRTSVELFSMEKTMLQLLETYEKVYKTLKTKR